MQLGLSIAWGEWEYIANDEVSIIMTEDVGLGPMDDDWSDSYMSLLV